LNRKDKVIVGLILNEGDSPSLVAVYGSLQVGNSIRILYIFDKLESLRHLTLDNEKEKVTCVDGSICEKSIFERNNEVFMEYNLKCLKDGLY
jgi:hypothetical protein